MKAVAGWMKRMIVTRIIILDRILLRLKKTNKQSMKSIKKVLGNLRK